MKFVFNQKGFLLLEHLIAIAIMGIISVGFFAVMQVISSYSVNQNTITMHEINSIAVRLQNEMRFADTLMTSDGRLDVHFANSDDVVSFFILNDRLVRRVNDRGGEILIYHVASMEVIATGDYSVRIILTCLSGNAFSFSLSMLQLNIDFPDEEEIELEEDGDKNVEE